MSEKWYTTAAFKESSSEGTVDLIFNRDQISRRSSEPADVFFYDGADEKTLIESKTPPHVLPLSPETPESEIPEMILGFMGRDFVSRLGHDIVNLIAPLADFAYLSDETILKRVKKGSRLGKQVNLIGHLLQNDIAITRDLDLKSFLFHLKSLARRSGVAPIFQEIEGDSFMLPSEKLMFSVALELISNWQLHSSGEEKVIVDLPNRKISLTNLHRYPFSFTKPKAVLRRPFYKQGNLNGNGLGLTLLSIAGIKGEFSWNIEISESLFSLSLSF